MSVSVFIDGDRTCFTSKHAMDRLKRDLKNDDKEKLAINDYFKKDWNYELLSNENNEIKIKLVYHKKEEPKVLDERSEKRNMLKKKLKDMKENRTNTNIKFNDDISKDVVDAYLQLKKFKLPIPIPSPNEVLEKKEEYSEEEPSVHSA
jgi:hypothetical protein